jgi:hypothetical protein
MRPHIEKVNPAGTKRLGSLSESSPVVVLFTIPIEAIAFAMNTRIIETIFEI